MSTLGNLQQQVADALSAAAFFAHIKVHTEQTGRIQSLFAMALSAATDESGKVGGFVCVMTPTANANWPEVNKPFFDDVDIDVQVTTHEELAADPTNGIGVTGLDICEAVCNTLHQLYLVGANAPLVVRTPTISLLDKDSDLTTRVCRFRSMGGLRTLPNPAATPVIAENTGTITLSCSTAGAAMFYTLDGSNPGPLNGSLYLAPFTPGAGLTLKVRAWLAGYLTSETAITTT